MTRDELLRLVPEAAARRAAPRPGKAALLVVDMQEYFRSMAAPILPAVARVIAACRDARVPVIHTQHGHADPDADGGMLSAWWGDLIGEGSPAWAILPEVGPGPSGTVVRKRRYSAFFGTGLEAQLRDAGVEELIVSGVMTNLCAETTARDAFVRDFRVFFLADGTATADPALHVASLRNLAFGFAHVLPCEAVVRALAKNRTAEEDPHGSGR